MPQATNKIGYRFAGKFSELLGMPRQFPGDLLQVLTRGNALAMIVDRVCYPATCLQVAIERTGVQLPSYKPGTLATLNAKGFAAGRTVTVKNESSTEWMRTEKILTYILRRALPYAKLFEALSVPEIAQGRRPMSNIRGPKLNVNKVRKTIKRLVDHGCLIRIELPNGTTEGPIYGLGPQFFTTLAEAVEAEADEIVRLFNADTGTDSETPKINKAISRIEIGYAHMLLDAQSMLLDFIEKSGMLDKLKEIQKAAQRKRPYEECFHDVELLEMSEDELDSFNGRYVKIKSDLRKKKEGAQDGLAFLIRWYQQRRCDDISR